MYVTAHRVRDQAGEEAIHAFLHEHGAADWPEDVFDWPETNPGRLVAQRTVLPVGGNSVLSYLDVLAPDGTEAEAVAAALHALRVELPERANPTTMVAGSVTLRFGATLGLEPHRAQALDELARIITELLGSSGAS